MVREIFSLHTGHLWSCNVTIVVLFSANPHLSLISSISDEFDEEESVDLVSLEPVPRDTPFSADLTDDNFLSPVLSLAV